MNEQQMLQIMIEKQNTINTQIIGDDWKERNLPWWKACLEETVEFMGHWQHWKWWKDQNKPIDKFQAKLEIVDIWAFGMSDLLVVGSELMLSHPAAKSSPETFSSWLLEDEAFNLWHFECLVNYVNMSFEELFRMYIAKTVLNKFRQDYGYKQGAYKKIWNGREDNKWLEEFYCQLQTVEDEHFESELYRHLENTYQNFADMGRCE